MKKPSDPTETSSLRQQLIGLGDRSIHKSYYPALQAHHAELERFRHLLDHSFDIILLAEEGSGTIIDANSTACTILGLNREELRRRTLFDLFPLDAAGSISRLIREPQAGLSRATDSCRIADANSTLVDIELSVGRVNFQGTDYLSVIARDITDRRRQEELIIQIAQAVAAETGESFFRTLMLNLASSLGGDYALIGELNQTKPGLVTTISAVADGTTIDNFTYALAGTPCSDVLEGGICSYAEGVAPLFPEDHLLSEMSVEGYVGTPLLNSTGAPLGIMVVLYRKPIENPLMAEQLLRIFAARAAAELDRRRQEESTQESEERFRTIFQSTPDAVIFADTEGVYLDVNRQFSDITGYAAEEVIDREGFSLWKDTEARNQALQRLKTTGVINNIEFSFLHKSGEERSGLLTSRTIMIGGNHRVLHVLRDISERKKIEMELRDSEERFRTIFAATPDAIVLADIDGRILAVNRGFTEITGFSRDELLGRTTADIGIWESPSQREEMLATLHARGGVDNYEAEFRVRDGAIRNGLLSARIISVGDKPKILVVVRDITQLKRTEAALRDSEERFRTLIANVPAAVYRVRHDAAHSALFFSASVEELTGHPAREFVSGGRSFFASIHPEDRERIKEEVDAAIAAHHPFSLEFRVERPDGTHRWVNDRGQGIAGSDGNIESIDGVLFDITERKEAEESLRRFDQAKNEFISTAAHELRTPLTSIMGYAELMVDRRTFGTFSQEQQDEFLSEIINKGESLSRIIDDLLDISRIQSGMPLDLSCRPTDIEQLLKRVTRQFSIQAPRHRIRITRETPLPPLIFIDGGRITQVMENLLSNAVKYTPGGGEIIVDLAAGKEMLCFSVHDPGIGMSPEQVGHVFDKFYRADSSNTAIGGLGLGMSIAKQIIEAHGGTIRVESTLGRGTSVTVELPIFLPHD